MNRLQLILLTGLLLFTATAQTEQHDALSGYKMPNFEPPRHFNFASGNIDGAAIGRQLYRRIRQQRPIIEDPELTVWLQALVQRLADKAPGGLGRALHIAIENNPEVNAHALQGGIIIINSGLILSSDTESELAAVLAHEIAHISQRHITRLMADRKNSPWLTGLGIIAGAAVASKDPQAGQAIIAGASALQAQRQIMYTQGYESEADRVGLRILSRAGLNPAAMPYFLEKLERSELNLYGDISKYLRSHPLTIERLSDTRNRVNQLGRRQVRESPDYLYAREKLRVIFDRTGTVAHQPLPEVVKQYQQALIANKRGNPQRVLQLLNKPSPSLASNLLKAQALHKLERYPEAARLLQPLLKRFPNSEALVLTLAQTVMAQGQAAQALQLLNRIRTSDKTSLQFLEGAQHIAQQAKQPQQAILYNAERKLRSGDYRYAILTLQQTLRTPNLAANIRLQLQNKLHEVQQAQQEGTYLKQR